MMSDDKRKLKSSLSSLSDDLDSPIVHCTLLSLPLPFQSGKIIKTQGGDREVLEDSVVVSARLVNSFFALHLASDSFFPLTTLSFYDSKD